MPMKAAKINTNSRGKRKSVYHIVPDAELQALKGQKAAKWLEYQEISRKLRELLKKKRLKAMRASLSMKIWADGEPPMTYREHERALQRTRRRRLAAEDDDFRLDPRPLPGDRFRKQG